MASQEALDDNTSRLVMPHACLACASRRVRCNRGSPKCATCVKRGVECVYQRLPPRPRRKRRTDDGPDGKAERYERLLIQHGLLENSAQSTGASLRPAISSPIRAPGPPRPAPGILIGGQGGTRYFDDRVWLGLGGQAIARGVKEAFEGREQAAPADTNAVDLLTAAVLDPTRQPLQPFHPSHDEAVFLWKAHLDRVEPICRLLHIPTAAHLIHTRSRQPELASPAEECLLFAIYHFAVYSLSEQESAARFPHVSRDTLLGRLSAATAQALVNANWLSTADLTVLQAVVFFLLASKHRYDANTYWIMTGAAVRIGQRIGVHRDGERLGVPPFEVELRRRLYYQLVPLDGLSSSAAGAELTPQPADWDCRPPLNVCDDNLFPGMTGPLVEQRGATDMIFSLARAHLGSYFLKVTKATADGAAVEFVESLIQQAEAEVEDKYIRFCDVVDCLHFLTICFVRAAIHAMRLRLRLARWHVREASGEQRAEIYGLTQKILDADLAIHSNAGLRKYSWHVRAFSVWGSWESFIYVLDTLCEPGRLSSDDIEASWCRIQQLYESRNLCDGTQVLHVAAGGLVLKAWDSTPSGNCSVEPAFLKVIRQTFECTPRLALTETGSIALENSQMPHHAATPHVSFGEFGFESADWAAWEEMIRSHR